MEWIFKVFSSSLVFPRGDRHDIHPGLLLPGEQSSSRCSGITIPTPVIVITRHLFKRYSFDNLCFSSSAVLHRGDLRERQRHGGNSGQRRLLSNHGRARAEPRVSAKHPEPDALLRHVRLLRAVRFPRQYLLPLMSCLTHRVHAFTEYPPEWKRLKLKDCFKGLDLNANNLKQQQWVFAAPCSCVSVVSSRPVWTGGMSTAPPC